MAAKLTIRDIARLAGVSKSTVSRVLTQSHDVDPATVQRVRQVMKEHDFVPSVHASSLKGKSQLLGILMPRYLWAALQEITWSIADYVSKRTRYEIIFYSNSRSEGYGRVVDQILQTNLVAGLITTLYDQPLGHLEDLYHQGFPVVLIDTIGKQSVLPTVGANHYQGAYEAIHYLTELGHRRIAYINGPEAWFCCQERYRAYCDALRAAGIEPDPMLLRSGDCTPQTGAEATRQLLALEQPPTAIFAANDDMAYGTITAAQECHIHVPDQLSVIGFNDDPVPFLRSTLTTVHQPFSEMARCAIELLVAMLQPQHTFSDEWQESIATTAEPIEAKTLEDIAMPCTIEFPTHLVIRNTCTVPPV